jgi:hypothetical protein
MNIKEQISLKEEELLTLKKQLTDQENNNYNHLIGKCFKIAPSCLIYVKEISQVYDDCFNEAKKYTTKNQVGKNLKKNGTVL